ncbi:ROK family transcriptional regulator [Labrys wisconsinensis]|uniref:NBD/HSP70 family sugar kinase n=1 Tax=Labrys wisconsinensis TaxID=425677 RepID=A0ABU0J1G8_9HYPH|nr:ROK family transcriptional regulator [Labrys wisconsinensis]MDQ0468098.1 putative NBD/HSP70 family sugar kinase [Labrys wisconsinensis]
MSRKGSNSVQIRHYNERVVLEALRRMGEASKADLARSANLTPQAVAGIVAALEEAGLAEPRGKRAGQIGQPSTIYAVAPDGALSIGLHVGRRALDAVLIDLAGRTRRVETSEYAYPEPQAVADLAAAYVRTLHSSLAPELRRRVVGVGVAMPYFLGGWRNELDLPLRVTAAWEEFDLRARLAEETDLPLHFQNDASSAATAELVYGHGQTVRDFIHFSVHTFIGGGLIIDGKLETGPHGNSAAFGPYPVGPSRLSTVPPPAGPFEILLRRASIYVLTHHLRANGVPINRAYELEALGERAEPYLSEWIADCADALATAIVGAIAVVDVSAVVIDGILPRAILERTVEAIRERFEAIVPEGLVVPAIRAGSIGSQAAAIGAAIIPLYAMFAPDSDVLVKTQPEPRRPTRHQGAASAFAGPRSFR